MTLRWLTAGESHGPLLVATLEGLPAGLALDEATLAVDLARRQRGYGRSGRQKIESDHATLVAGVRHGRTLGSPVTVTLPNRDHANWGTRMQAAPLAEGQDAGPRVTLPRPGHADLAGALKYGHTDLRNVLERASARETAARVALGAIAKALLASVDVTIGSQVRSIRDVHAKPWDALVADAAALNAAADASDVRTADTEASPRMVEAIVESQRRRDTVGGTFEVVASGLPPGLGSYAQWDRRLDARLVAALVSIPAVKAAEVGDGWAAAAKYGTEVHDPISRSGPAFSRPTNHAGGIEGGITNGEPVVCRAAMKPIATVSNALPSIDLDTGEVDRAHVERSDTCAVPAAAVVGEAVVALALAQALLETCGADSIDALRAAVRGQWKRARRLPGHVFLCGLSGAGKSTVGPRLAEALALSFRDLDVEIERDAGRSIASLFADGEAVFRAQEVATLRRLAAGERAVVALGGGTVTQRAARDVIRRSGDLLHLDADDAVLAERVGAAAGRPLFANRLPIEVLSELRAARADAHAMAADACVDADGTVEHVVERCRGALR